MCWNQKRKTRSSLAPLLLLLAAAVSQAQAPSPVTNVPHPGPEYGRVIIDKYSSKAGLGPVTFDHWLHRAKFTCRLCHVDIGFAMQANATDIRASTNRQGFHCGACHDGKRQIDGKVVFAACSEAAPTQQCARCHSRENSGRKYDYETFTARLPKNAYGIDWEEAEATGLVKPIDALEGISIKKPALKTQADFAIQARVNWVSDIIFSHKKHAVWNGCEVCHPDIFPAAQKGVVRYTMFHLSSGQYCGVCHGKVAFPVTACGGCHKDMANKEALTDVVVLPAPARAAGFGAVKFMHKTHVGEHEIKCEVCHHRPTGWGTQEATEQNCSKCHTRDPQLPVRTPLERAFHNSGASGGLCIDCHKQENAKKFNNDVEFARNVLPNNQLVLDAAHAQLIYGKDPEMRQLAQEIITDRQSEMDQMQHWLKEHDSAAWAPVKCRDCHKRMNNASLPTN
jgi:c(7)-type cytochrome triheme protein